MAYKPLILLRPYAQYVDDKLRPIHFGRNVHCGIKMYDNMGNSMVSVNFKYATKWLYINGI